MNSSNSVSLSSSKKSFKFLPAPPSLKKKAAGNKKYIEIYENKIEKSLFKLVILVFNVCAKSGYILFKTK